MSPDTIETRMRQVEDRSARTEQKVDDLRREFERRLNDMNDELGKVLPIVRELGEVVVELRGVKQDIVDVRADVQGVRTTLSDRDKQATDERRAVRVALLALTGVIASALIAAVATIVAAGITP